MKKVILRAPCLSQSGYGVHSRQIGRYLLERNDVELNIMPVQWGCTPWYVNKDEKKGLVGKLLDKSGFSQGPWDVSVQLQLPNEWDPNLAKVNIGMTAGVETDICNPAWIDCIQKMTKVIVPSEHIKGVFVRTASKVNKELDVASKIVVVPESFIDEILNNDVKPVDIDFDTSFNFMLLGQLTGRSSTTDRKNTFNAIKWFCETFKDDPDVGLVIKTNSGRETKIDRRLTKDMLLQLLKVVRKGPYPKVHFVHGMMNDDEIASLYRHPKIKALLSLTRGEGFGLPILEAAASGMPVIATNWSAHLDFMNLGKFIKLDFDLVEIHKSKVDNQIFMEGSKWAEVRESDVKRKLQKFRNRSDVPSQWAVELKAKLQEKFSFDVIKRLYDEAFSEFLE